MLNLWRKRPMLVSAFLLAVALTLFFGVRLVRHTLYWADPAHHNEAIQPWMTVGYIAKSWHLDGPEIDALAHLPGPKDYGHPPPLSEIAKDRGVPVAKVIKEVEAAISVLKAQQP
jgi:hypothetical protein